MNQLILGISLFWLLCGELVLVKKKAERERERERGCASCVVVVCGVVCGALVLCACGGVVCGGDVMCGVVW